MTIDDLYDCNDVIILTMFTHFRLKYFLRFLFLKRTRSSHKMIPLWSLSFSQKTTRRI